MASPPAPTVFISYSHDSHGHGERVLSLSDRLRKEGIDCTIDQYETSPEGGWAKWSSKQIEIADLVLIVCTAIYKRRYEGDEEADKGRGASWEGAIITNSLYELRNNNIKFIPVIFTAEDAAYIPIELRGATHFEVHDDVGYEQLYRRLTGQPAVQKPPLGERRILPPQPSLIRVQTFTSIVVSDCRSYAQMFEQEIKNERAKFQKVSTLAIAVALIGVALIASSIFLPNQHWSFRLLMLLIGATLLSASMWELKRTIEKDSPVASYEVVRELFKGCEKLTPEKLEQKIQTATMLLGIKFGIPPMV